MIILGIETSCDETAAAVLTNNDERITILSNIVASSASIQAKYGGVIPEQAAREQIKAIIPVIEEALIQSNLYPPSSKHHLPSSTIYRPAIDAIAVTYGPGLVGSLLVGVETAKVLATVWNKPLIPVNHLIGHFYANWISLPTTHSPLPPTFPCIGLLASGGHTDLVLFTDHGKYTYLGGTRDDAAGECFDKCARLLGLPYPGGPEISKLATKGDAFRFNLPRPMINSDDFDFSFSGLKTAVANLIKTHPVILEGAKRPIESRTYRSDKSDLQVDNLPNLAASIEQAIVDVLVAKVIKAAKVYKVNQIMIAGGVAANQKLASELKKTLHLSLSTSHLFIPPPHLCTDNAAMIASAAFFEKPIKNPLTLQADPNLAL